MLNDINTLTTLLITIGVIVLVLIITLIIIYFTSKAKQANKGSNAQKSLADEEKQNIKSQKHLL